MSVSKAWHNFHFCVDYPFKLPATSWPKVETPQGKTSLLKMPVCSFMTLNPEDWIPLMNLSCSQLWFEQYSQSRSDRLHYWWPSLFSPCCYFSPRNKYPGEIPGKATLLRSLLGCLLGMLILSKLSLFDLSLLSPTDLSSKHTTCSKTLGSSHRCTAVHE